MPCPNDPALVLPIFQSHKLISDRIAYAVSPSHDLASVEPGSLRPLFDYPVAMPVLEPMYQDQSQKIFAAELGRSPAISYCSSISLLTELALDANYVIFGPAMGFRESAASGDLLVRPLPIEFPHEIYLHTNMLSLPIPAVSSVMDIFEQEAVLLDQELNP